MNTIIQEAPAVFFEGKPKDPDQVVEEDMTSSMFEFRVFLPSPIEEMSDAELLAAAEAVGTFRFLDADGENIYRL